MTVTGSIRSVTEGPGTYLAPDISEHRAVIRGLRTAPFLAAELEAYLPALVAVIGMRAFTPAYVATCDDPPYVGPSGWIGITTSGIQVHAFPAREGRLPYVVVDVFSCRAFDPEAAREFTAGMLGLDPCIVG